MRTNEDVREAAAAGVPCLWVGEKRRIFKGASYAKEIISLLKEKQSQHDIHTIS